MAKDCYNFFFGHFFRKKANTERFLPKENIKIYYDLDFESKRDIYEHLYNQE
jgi:hypothetical protein